MSVKIYLVLEKVAKLTGERSSGRYDVNRKNACRENIKKQESSKHDENSKRGEGRLNVKLGDICTVHCCDAAVQSKIEHLTVCVLDVQGRKHVRKLVSLTEMISLIEGVYPDADISASGENQVMIDYEMVSERRLLKPFLVAFMCIFSFIGSMYVIMAYNNDVGTTEIFEKVYYQLGIQEYSGLNIMETAYGVGLALGIIEFYNHFGKLRLSDAPTPIQIEMDKYEKDEEDSLIARLSAPEKND